MSVWKGNKSVYLLASAITLVGCDAPVLDTRSREIVSVLAEADQSFIRARPDLSRTKYEVMASDLFQFYRGTFPLYLHDAEEGSSLSASSFQEEGLVPLTIGDAHPENFGSMRALDGTFAVEPNDFDAADRYPYLWEVRRLAIGLVIATRSSNPDDPEALSLARAAEHDIAASVARGYATGIVDLDHRQGPGRLVDGGDNAVLIDIFDRSTRDAVARPELDSETILDPDTGHRSLKRGVLDPTDPLSSFGDLPNDAIAALPQTIADYRETLIQPPDLSYFRILDAARVFGSGVASLPKVRIAILVEGPSSDPSDDVILELKELGDSGAHGWGRPTVSADDPDGRVLNATRQLWARPDAEPLWGTATLLGLPVQIKGEFDAYKGVKVKRLVQERGTPEALEGLGFALGQLVARMHAQGARNDVGMLHTIAASIGRDPDRFVEEQAQVAVRYANSVEADFGRFQTILRDIGPRLGIPEDLSDRPSPDVDALFGHPEPTQ